MNLKTWCLIFFINLNYGNTKIKNYVSSMILSANYCFQSVTTQHWLDLTMT